MSFFKMDAETAARVREKIRRADLAMRERELAHKARRAWIRSARKRAGGPCGATTKKGLPCGRKALASGFCQTHGGVNAAVLWSRMEGSTTPRLPQGSPSSEEPMRKDAVFLPCTRTCARERKKA
jgi:hypothetical protein